MSLLQYLSFGQVPEAMEKATDAILDAASFTHESSKYALAGALKENNK